MFKPVFHLVYIKEIQRKYFVTLFIVTPLLLISFVNSRKYAEYKFSAVAGCAESSSHKDNQRDKVAKNAFRYAVFATVEP